MERIRGWTNEVFVTPTKSRTHGTAANDSTSLLPYQSVGQSDSDVLPQEAPQVSWSWMKFLAFCGSGLMMSVSYLDPGNLEADIQVGVVAGYGLLWWYGACSVLFGLVFQCLSGALGLVTGLDLATHCGKKYPRRARILLWVLLEFAIIGADIQETIGSAIALSILTGNAIPLWAGCIIISISAFALLLLDRFGLRQLEIVFFLFISVEAIALGINFFAAQIPPIPLIEGLIIPQLSSRTLPVAVGALGALVMPYNLFFQSSIVNARPREREGGEAQMSILLSYMRLENAIMLILAFVINIFVVCVFADGFYDPSLPPVEIGLESAGEHLAQRFGVLFKYAWAVGLLASGQVATITLTYAGQLVMTGLLDLKVTAGSRMMATRLVALVPTVVMAVVFETSQTFDYAAQLLNVAQSVLLPFALLPVLRMTADRDIMGERFVSPKWLTITGSVICAVILGINGYLIVDVFRVSFVSSQGSSVNIFLLAILVAATMIVSLNGCLSCTTYSLMYSHA